MNNICFEHDVILFRGEYIFYVSLMCVYAKISYFCTVRNEKKKKNIIIFDNCHPQLFSEIARKNLTFLFEYYCFTPTGFYVVFGFTFSRVHGENYDENFRKMYSPITYVQTNEWREWHNDKLQIMFQRPEIVREMAEKRLDVGQ